MPLNFQQPSAPDFITAEGVYYASLNSGGQNWHMGSVSASWAAELAALGSAPDQGALESAATRGVWLRRVAPPPGLGVMCCGMGSAWPHMGRALYDNFPACRQAMDKLASLADWDLLGLLDEGDLDVINDTRRQIPYLFLLEYAQWSQFASLGLKPDLLCGHSLGELAALCFAGVYSVESAWYLLDTRAEHMAELEAKAGGRGGMLAVAAGREVIDEVLEKWPALSIANFNAPRQFILGGPRKEIMEARKALRRKRIPAMALGIGLAFHNPAMAVLRGQSLRRLNGLEMRAPAIPMLSCVKLDLYPPDQPGICEYIADLDENMVDWPGALGVMTRKWGVKAFLELGPRDTLCGLALENGYANECVAASGKDREVEAMREACARLFAMNLIPGALAARPIPSFPHVSRRSRQTESPPAGSGVAASPELGAIIEILAEVAGVSARDLRLDMDLRHDLGLQSSRFPLLIQEAEDRLGRQFELEGLLKITTVGDLAAALIGPGANAPQKAKSDRRKPSGPRMPYQPRGFYLRRSEWRGPETAPAPLKLDPALISNEIAPGSLIAFCLLDSTLPPSFFQEIAALGPRLAIPAELLPRFTALEDMGAKLIPLDWPVGRGAEAASAALERLEREHGAISGIFLALPARRNGKDGDFCEIINAVFSRAASWRVVFQRLQEDAGLDGFFSAVSVEAGARAVAWLADDFGAEEGLAAALLPWELIYGKARAVVWRRAEGGWPEDLCGSSSWFDFARPKAGGDAGELACSCQFSSFDPLLGRHGRPGAFSPGECYEEGQSAPPGSWLPLSSGFYAALETALIESPWLLPVGFSDTRVFSFPSLPAGVARECRAVAHLKPWLPQEGRMARMCRVDVEARALHQNGRAKDHFGPMLGTVCLLGREGVAPRPVWSGPGGYAETPAPGESLASFYETIGLPGEWRFVKSLRTGLLSNGWPAVAVELAPAWSMIAARINWRYMFFLQLADGLLQAALAAISLAGEATDGILAALGRWRLSAIGYLRFDGSLMEVPPQLGAELRCSWSDGHILRFDAQVSGKDQRPVLTAHHWEFERAGSGPE